MTEPYSQAVREHFANPRHAGDFDDGVAISVDDQGVRIRLVAACTAGTIQTLRFRAWGCPHLLAACEAFCAQYEGCAADDLVNFNGSELMQTLAVPAEKTGRILVLEDAVRLLGTAVRGTSGENH